MANKMTQKKLYTGSGHPGETGDWQKLPSVDHRVLTDPQHYLAPQGLADAVNVALTLSMPLLLTGEPGVGKSRLAASIAWEYGFPEDNPLEFVVKSDTLGRDLFYEYDTLGRFHGGGGEENTDPAQFITYNALGKAILNAKGRDKVRQLGVMIDDELEQIPESPCRSVVLIDEIDKAPRDVPNDILSELDDLKFTIPELKRQKVSLDDAEKQQFSPIVVITSNSEKDLPDAFLRRCVYYHIPFPPFENSETNEDQITVEKIVTQRLGTRFAGADRFLSDVLSLFAHIRKQRLNKRPSLAELLNWLYYLAETHKHSGFPESLGNLSEKKLLVSLGAVFKTSPDSEQAASIVKAWRPADSD